MNVQAAAGAGDGIAGCLKYNEAQDISAFIGGRYWLNRIVGEYICSLVETVCCKCCTFASVVITRYRKR